ncbi:hypothetical protein G3578_15780 [Brevibacillus sp. SYP-B805]|uniref:hypothetical protein n=1 Tax=Brevibacillus sp. SYP-B805 TaxID=1578199 RepID=UPI0013EE3621|nr:hypothetical protein [Brevibacillus sp. SYP-B805]NGQ96623.1 hypothetical protein [Brevibacillus sp. SYP-B805]
MKLSPCCGAATKVENRSDHPLLYDDAYDFQVPALVCTKCGKVFDPLSREGGSNTP